ncbi:MAG: U32 family peptidase [Chloroflexota bacterium]|nr:U32 family peptidase [Chloroflexota bacterium]
MRLLVPTNWDTGLIAPLSQIGADIQIFGVLPISIMGSGMSGPNIAQMTAKQAEDYIERAHSAGLTFNYLLNAPCLNNMEWHEDTHRELLRHFEWLSNAGVDSVTIAIPYLIEIVKSQFPHLKVEVSTIAHVNSVARAKLFESMGADSIIIDSNVNRDFKLLRAIREAVGCELGVLTNSLCLYQCPYEYYHNNTLAHATQSHNPLNGFYMDYCVLNCTLSRLSDTSQFIKSRWIRPEDIHIYQGIGIDFFKIGGRAMPTEWIINATSAYSSLHYQGNLYDVLIDLTPKIGDEKAALSDTQVTTFALPSNIYIDNQALGGFIDFFEKQDCLSGCAHCNYCQKVADKVVKMDIDEVDKCVYRLKSLLNDLTGSKIFHSRV